MIWRLLPCPKRHQAHPASTASDPTPSPDSPSYRSTVSTHALLTHGARILEEELGLDPRVFRLVCIPPDVYVRLGEADGWGRHPRWTHFDGYLIRTVASQVQLQALAGGDVRYGGIYDLLGLGREYDSDRLLARFAVVQRSRMVAW